MVRRHVAFSGRTEGNVDFYVVIHQRNQRKGRTRVGAEPENEWHEQGRGWNGGLGRGQGRSVADHDSVTVLLLSDLGQLVVNGEPHTVVPVDNRTSDFDRDLVEDYVTNVTRPRDGLGRTIGRERRQVDLEVRLVDQITVAGDKARYLATKIGISREGLFH